MKRNGIIILVTALLLVLCACHMPSIAPDPTDVETTNPPAPSSRPEEIPSVPVLDPIPSHESEPERDDNSSLVAIILAPVHEDFRDESTDSNYLTYDSQGIRVVIPRYANTADRIQYSMQERVRTYYEEAVRYAGAIAEYDTEGQHTHMPFSASLLYEPGRVDERIISFCGKTVQFLGGAHSEVYISTVNFDAVTGDELHLSELLKDPDTASDLKRRITEYLSEHFDEIQLYPGYEKVVAAHLEGEESENWYLSNDGLTFCFSPYDVATYATGPISITFGYDEIGDLIQEKWLPLDAEYVPFTVEAMLADMAEQDTAEHVLPLVLEADGEKIWISTDTIMNHVRIIYHDFYDVDMWKDHTLLAANRLGAFDAILLSTYIPDGMATLAIQADLDTEAYQTYDIYQSGEDGSIILNMVSY